MIIETTMLTRRKLWALTALTAVMGCTGTPPREKVSIRMLEPIVVPIDVPDDMTLDSSIQEFAFRAAANKLEPGAAYNVEIWTESETVVVVTFMPVILDNPFYVDVRVSVEVGEPYTLRVREEDLLRSD